MLLFKAPTLVRPAGLAACWPLGLAILVWVVEHSGAPNGEVVVHVLEADVEVTIGGSTYRIPGRRHEPIVRELPGGRHELVMRRGGRVLYAQEFELRRGESLVLTAWDPARLGAGPAGRRPPAGSSGPASQ